MSPPDIQEKIKAIKACIDFRVEQPLPGVHLFVFKNRYDLAMSFVRMQEFYESPEPRFRGKYFSLEDYMDWYVKSSGSDFFTYPSEWSAFNIPGNVWWEFGRVFAGHQDLRVKELAVRWFSGCLDASKIRSMYFIGVCERKGKRSDIRHELAHALWYLLWSQRFAYGERARELVSKLPSGLKKNLRKGLMTQGYCEDVLDDEINAYLSTGNTVPGYGSVPLRVAKPFQASLKTELAGHLRLDA